MDIKIDDEKIEKIVNEQIEKTIRTRIKEMQGNYTSKVYLEKLIEKIIWEKISQICPCLENQLEKKVDEIINCQLSIESINKAQMIEMVVEGLFNKFIERVV